MLVVAGANEPYADMMPAWHAFVVSKGEATSDRARRQVALNSLNCTVTAGYNIAGDSNKRRRVAIAGYGGECGWEAGEFGREAPIAQRCSETI